MLTSLPPLWAIVTQSGKLNFLETSGHLGPVNGTALPFYPVHFMSHSVTNVHHVQEFLMLKQVVPAFTAVFCGVNTANVNSAQGEQNKRI